MFCDGGCDWAVTGTMLQGIGTIVGALAVIVAALVGGGTFRAWRRQQLIQRHMNLAERIMVAVYKARDQIRTVRHPLKTAAEMQEASKALIANSFDLASLGKTERHRLESAQVTFERLRKFDDTWSELELCKPAANAYFGDEIPLQIDKILRVVHVIGVDADAYAHDDGSDAAFTQDIRNTLSWARVRGSADQLGDEVSEAVKKIEDRLRPLLQEVASEAQRAFADALTSTLIKSLRINLFP